MPLRSRAASSEIASVRGIMEDRGIKVQSESCDRASTNRRFGLKPPDRRRFLASATIDFSSFSLADAIPLTSIIGAIRSLRLNLKARRFNSFVARFE